MALPFYGYFFWMVRSSGALTGGLVGSKPVRSLSFFRNRRKETLSSSATHPHVTRLVNGVVDRVKAIRPG